MRKKHGPIVSVELDPAKPPQVTSSQKRELAALARMTDEAIDYSDIPELPTSAWQKAVRAGLYRPVKRQLTVRIDADILEWLRCQGVGHHSRLNRILRSAMLADLKYRTRRNS